MKVFPTFAEDRSPQTETLKNVAHETIGETYIEEDPSVAEWFRECVPTSQDAAGYVRELFPSARWIRRYNLHWLAGDAIAGITVGLVVVPQAMAYASLARLSPAFGLYTTFTGACLYWIFGTSRDIVIGTTAVGSLLIGSAVSKIEAEHPGKYEPQQIAHALSFLAGIIILAFGILRLGFIIEFIPYIPISAFVTSASITIISTQLPTLMGVRGINTRDSPYKVYVNFLEGLPRARLDAAIGITSIVLLYLIKNTCAKMEMRQPQRKKTWSMISSLRLTFTILLYTLISWLVNRTAPAGQEKFRIVGHIEKGFSHAGVPKMDGELFGLVSTELPAIIIILIVEHIAIAKNFGRKHNYTVIPSQEMIAQGAANILSPFVGGYVCTAVFYYIPNAALAGLIIHSTVDLIKGPKDLYKYYQLSPFELFIWVCGVVIAFFTDLETAIYITVGLSFAMLLVRMAKSPGKFRGSVGVTRIVREDRSRDKSASTSSTSMPSEEAKQTHLSHFGHTKEARQVYIPYDAKDNHNPSVNIEPAYPGVFIYRFSENFNYVNQAYHVDYLASYITSHTRRTQADDGIRACDRLWCDAPPTERLMEESSSLPVLRAVVLDFSTVNILDITSIDGLKSLRETLDRYAAPGLVEWHFAGVHNRWTRKALSFAGFGFPATTDVVGLGDWCPAYTVTTSLAGAMDEENKEMEAAQRKAHTRDEESGKNITQTSEMQLQTNVPNEKRQFNPIYGIDRPFFHLDLYDAVDAAVRDARKADQQTSVPGQLIMVGYCHTRFLEISYAPPLRPENDFTFRTSCDKRNAQFQQSRPTSPSFTAPKHPSACFHSGYVSGYVSGDGGGVLHGVPQLAEPEKSGYFVGDVVLAWTEEMFEALGFVLNVYPLTKIDFWHALAIRDGTLDYKGCMAQFYERKHNFANDAELLPDIRQRGVTIFDDAIGFGVLTAIGEGKPVISVLQELLVKIGSLYLENQQRLEQAPSDAARTPANKPDKLPRQITNNGTESEEARLFESDGDSDNPDDAADSGSDCERKGRKRPGRAKRKPGRPKTKDLKEKNVNEAVLMRQKRKRLSHRSPKKLGRDPKRRLYESLGDSSEIAERASASPSSLVGATRKFREDDATSPSPSSALAANDRGKYQKASRTSSKHPVREYRRNENSANTNAPSLIVKLRIRSLVVQLQVPTTQKHHPETPSKSSQAHRTRGIHAKRRRKVKSAEFVSADAEESNNGEEGAQPDSTQPISETTIGPASKITVESTDMGYVDMARSKFQSTKTAQPQGSERQVENKSTTKRPTRQRRGDQVKSTSFRNDTPASFYSKQQKKASRQQRGAIAQADDGEEIDVAPTATSSFSSAVHAPPLSTGAAACATRAQPLPYTFAPFPPTLSPRALTPFHRGAIIALENVLADHADTPEDSPLDLVTELDDTRPIVSDWEHVTVMKGGSWVFQVLRDVWEDKEAEREEEDDGELVNVEDVVGALEGWVGREMDRLGGVVEV
ncbi:sulfate permease [Stemphylium lycopersici]|uniref:Sulfate permease n=1 Tax=Stemphylium lycopersici TaxID=183478 RepID=A0A364N9W4_STELY|nr:sulfate permease [Stemphylium lycopersici]